MRLHRITFHATRERPALGKRFCIRLVPAPCKVGLSGLLPNGDALDAVLPALALAPRLVTDGGPWSTLRLAPPTFEFLTVIDSGAEAVE